MNTDEIRETSILYPFRTLASHTHNASIALAPLSNTVFSPSKYSFSKFSTPKLKLLENGPDFGRVVNGFDPRNSMTEEDKDFNEIPSITLLKVVEKKLGEEIVYVAAGNSIYIVRGNIVIRKIVTNEQIISFCWIGDLICVLGKRYITLYDEKKLKSLHRESIPQISNAIIKKEILEDQESTATNDTLLEAIKKSNDIVNQLTSETYFTPFVSRVEIPQDSTPKNIYHIPTYLNKVLITTEEGHIDLINVSYGTLIYRYGPFKRSESDDIDRNLYIMKERKNANKSEYASISYLEIVPDALDIIAIGLSDGKILIHDIYTDETLETFRHGTSPVTSLAFRTDGESSMVSGSDNGSIAVWNLYTGKLVANYPVSHMGSILSLTFIRGTPLLISSSIDNSIKLWEFLTPEKIEWRYSAEGHAITPTKLRFYGPSGRFVISAGPDRQLRITNIQNGISKAFIHKRITTSSNTVALDERNKFVNETLDSILRPPIVDFDFSFMRERDWPSLVTAHKKDASIVLWNVSNTIMTNILTSKEAAEVSCVAVSTCGNYLVIGRKDGVLELWNLQSKRKKSNLHSRNKKDKKRTTAHKSTINSIIIDNQNQYIFSGGFDGVLRIWNLNDIDHLPVKEIELNKPISKIIKSKNTNMIAVTLSDFSIRLYDSESFRHMRTFKGHQYVVNDICFSSDSRYMYSCANDCFIIVWDIISGDIVEWIQVPTPAISIDVDSKDMYIVTSHSNSVGLAVWLNKITFGVGSLKHVDSPLKVNLPMMGDSFHHRSESWNIESNPEEHEEHITDKQFQKLINKMHKKSQKGLIHQLGSEHEQKILSIRKMDVLRERAKLVQITDKDSLKDSLPFFIETEATNFFDTKFIIDDSKQLNSNSSQFDASIYELIQPELNKPILIDNDENMNDDDDSDTHEKKKDTIENVSRIGAKIDTPPSSRLIQLIMKANQIGKDREVYHYLNISSPKIIDMSIRLLSSFDDYHEIKEFLRFILRGLKTFQPYDLIQSMLNLFLQSHDEVIISGTGNVELYNLLINIYNLQSESWNKIEEKFSSNLFLCKHLSNLQ